ncbi:MAG: hypothetical protein H6741_28550 [Alphaproteobacteria bacterium]|nr:hypothetical protein [Alphaproteobacteria bacterium]MCB9796668.1 hypothetical protein [Alphaproteobacteria bacterium]
MSGEPMQFCGYADDSDITVTLTPEGEHGGRFTLYEFYEDNRMRRLCEHSGRYELRRAGSRTTLTLRCTERTQMCNRECANPNCQAPPYVTGVFDNRYRHCPRKDCFQPELPAGWRSLEPNFDEHEIELEGELSPDDDPFDYDVLHELIW